MSCSIVRNWRIGEASSFPPAQGRMYLCNCNGIRQKDAKAAIAAGATKPADIFRHCQGAPQCAKCVCDMRCMIQAAQADIHASAQDIVRPAAERAA